MKCKGLTRSGSPCPLQAVKDGLCFEHSQISHLTQQADIFLLSPDDVAFRIRSLTWKQVQAVELLCNGETYHSAGVILGIDAGTFTNRITLAVKRTGVRTRQELIALYAVWRGRKAGERMTDKFS